MQLDIQGQIIDNPTTEQITEVIYSESRRGEYFILIKDEYIFLQATGPNDQLIVEFRDGEISDMYSASELLTCDQLQALCNKFINGESNWNANHTWKPMGFI